MAALAIPFLTTYDPPGASEGALDPLGLYRIADQLATRLVPAVRERMQRVRFLTVMAVGALVTEGLEVDPKQPEIQPFLVWEWLVVEAIVRTLDEDHGVRGVPGTLVTRRAITEHGYLDQRSYLKTPRIFGFHGVYKRLANHLGLMDVHLRPRPECERLVHAWAKGAGYSSLADVQPLLDKWRLAIERSMSQRPARTRTSWARGDWTELAGLAAPASARWREKKLLRRLLHSTDDRRLGALPAIWRLQDEFDEHGYTEKLLHKRLKQVLPSYTALLDAIAAYEDFGRGLTDAFDVLRADAGMFDTKGFEITSLGQSKEATSALRHLDRRHEMVRNRLGAIDSQMMALFDERFARFAEPMSTGDSAAAICEHHEQIQKGKSADGKRAWFDRLGPGRIYMRHQYREPRRPDEPGQYVHAYRGRPVRDFYRDLR